MSRAALLLSIVMYCSCSTVQEKKATEENAWADSAEEIFSIRVCSDDGARELVENFLSAYVLGQSGDHLADRFFASDDRFEWYSDTPTRVGEEAKNRESLDAYFVRQHMNGDSLTLVDFSYSGYRGEDDTGHFGMVLSRMKQSEQLFIGKGAIDCSSGTIIVWTVGPAASD